MNRVAIVVLNWNGIDDTLECLDSLQQQTYKNYSIVVIDNGSKDGSVAKLKDYAANHDNTTILYNKVNQGFAGGVNTGIHWALDHDFDGVALFNNDAIADKDWLKELIKAMKGDIGITTGLLLHRDGQTIDSTGDWYSVWGLPFPRNRGDAADKAPKSEFVFSGSGGASLYRLDMLSEIGFFDDDFFAYYEDVDVSFRAQLAGYKVYYTPKAIAYHKQGATSAKIPGFAVYQTMKNLPLLYAKDVPRGLRHVIGGRFYFAYLLIILNAIKNGNGKMALRGVKDSWRLRPKAWRARRRIQSRKQVSNDYLQSLLWMDLPPDQTGIRKLRKFFTGK